MKRRDWVVTGAVGLAALGMMGIQAQPANMGQPGATKMTMARPDALTWAPAPPGLPQGAQAAVLSGDPGKAGRFAIRLKAPEGYRIAPHTHPTDEVVTVISGTFHMGSGQTFTKTAAQAYPAGSFLVMPAGMAHFAWTEGDTVVQIEAQGPFVINYVNPKDDPRQQGVGGSGAPQAP